MACPCGDNCTCKMNGTSTAPNPTTQPTPPTYFSFTNGKGQHSAFAFILVKDNNNCEYRVVAYLEDYNPAKVSDAFLPYRELLPAEYKFFAGDLRVIPKFGTTQKVFDCLGEQKYTLPKVFRLRFVIPDGSDKKPHGTLIGLAEVADGNEKLPGHLGLRVFRIDNLALPINKNWPIKSATLLYVATLGGLPPLPPKPAADC